MRFNETERARTVVQNIQDMEAGVKDLQKRAGAGNKVAQETLKDMEERPEQWREINDIVTGRPFTGCGRGL